MGAVFAAMLRREMALAWRGRTDVLLALSFFVVVVCLFPFGIGPEANQLRAIAPGVVWVTALLASLLALPRLFEHDLRDGTLEQLLLSPEPAVVWVLAKVVVHWLVTGVPVALFAPLLAGLYDLQPEVLPLLAGTLLLGTPTLTLIGAIGAALTLGVRSGAVLLALLVLPLAVPVLIFGAGAVEAALGGVSYAAHLALLGAGGLAAVALAPWACVAALRLAVH